ncbi:MAG TPA: NAD(P)H-dependent oxidoreductase [Gammaproteobacteria bacterium]|nr:NAD(P)H-dependent oxidoreductase [Gammaproteobacteria bacterium]
MRNILIIQGHPDAAPHYGHALAQAYREAARHAGHAVREIDVAQLEFPLLRSKQDFENGSPPDPIRGAQEAIAWAGHIVIFYPLWLGSMPALLKGFLEQVFRPGFALPEGKNRLPWKKRPGGRSAHIVITMGMPALFYRWYFRAHSLKSLERNILGFCGIRTVRESLVGLVEALDGAARQKWLYRMANLGMAAK